MTATTLYEVDADGLPTTVPLGQSGPFVLTIDSEEVLCSSFSEGVCEVYQFEGTSGRGYNTTTLATHSPGVAAVSLTYTSVQSVLTGGDVTSVFARTGDVVAGNADYLAVSHGGLTGAVAATRLVGGTVSGAPVTGTFAAGDFVPSLDGNVYICTVAGTSGTWVGTAAANFTASSTVTLTNKRVTRRTLAYTANSATPAINTDNYDFVDMIGQTTPITSMSSSLTGTPVNGDLLQIALTGSATAVTWGSSFESSTVALPTITVLTTRLDSFFAWNPVTSKWRIYMVS